MSRIESVSRIEAASRWLKEPELKLAEIGSTPGAEDPGECGRTVSPGVGVSS
jgi:hypothetical protein